MTAPQTTAAENPAPTSPAPTVRDLVSAWLDFKDRIGAWSTRTTARTGADVRLWAVPGHTPLAQLATRAHGEPFMLAYLQRLAPLSLVSQRKRWCAVVEMCKWAERREWLARSPVSFVDPEELPWRTRRARRLMALQGKPKLNRGEAQAYVRAALRLEDPAVRVAVLLPLLCGLRSGEVRMLRVGDVHVLGGLLEIRGPHLKSPTSERSPPLPRILRADVAQLRAEQPPGEWLIRPVDTSLRPAEDRWLWRQVQRVCAAAGVTTVGPHGLRGTWATLTHQAGASLPDVAAGLGHARGDVDTVRAHYVTHGVQTPTLDLDGAAQREFPEG